MQHRFLIASLARQDRSQRRPRRACGWAWPARLFAAALGVYELRCLVGSLSSLDGMLHRLAHLNLASTRLWLVVLVSVGVVAMLREMSRGLPGRGSRSRWKMRLVGVWAVGTAVLAAISCGEEFVRAAVDVGRSPTVSHLRGVGGGVPLAAWLSAGVLLVAAVTGARWAAQSITSWCRPFRLLAASLLRLGRVERAARQGRLRGEGWSSRGPPLGLAVRFSLA